MQYYKNTDIVGGSSHSSKSIYKVCKAEFARIEK